MRLPRKLIEDLEALAGEVGVPCRRNLLCGFFMDGYEVGPYESYGAPMSRVITPVTHL